MGQGLAQPVRTAHCDNQAVVNALQQGCRPHAAPPESVFHYGSLGDHFMAIHIPGVDNTGADAISRDNLILFHFQVPEARPSPTPLPQALIDLVVHWPPRLDVAELVPVVWYLFEAGLAPSTRKSYKSGVGRYLAFCDDSGLPAFPASEEVVLFIAHLHSQHLAHGTVKSYLAAIRHGQISRGMDSPNIPSMPRVEYVLKGSKRCTPASSRRRLPNTPSILAAVKTVWQADPNIHDAKMLWAAACLCFFGFLRSGEATCPSVRVYDPLRHLGFADVRVDSRATPSALQVTIKAPKTDPCRQGVTLLIGAAWRPSMPSRGHPRLHGRQGRHTRAAFRAGRQFLMRTLFVDGVRTALLKAGFAAEDYAGHSFRIGAATTAARRGLQD